MSDVTDRTHSETLIQGIPASEPSAPDPHRGPFDDVRVERPKTHPVTYAALALGTLALLLSILAMARNNDDGYRRVQVNSQDCVIGSQNGTDVLYCRTPAP